jgi:murein DD-endopeptidase MepM/ murein hydrolase activator NlpD
MRFAHYAHCKQILVKVGQHVKTGQKISILGGTGTHPGHPSDNAVPHLHFEIWKQDPKIRGYNSYTEGLSKQQVQAIYEDPTPYTSHTIPTLFDHLGYGFLARVSSNTLHPGLDINGPGQDLGQPEYSIFDGTVVWIGTNVDGWGNHFYIKQDEVQSPPPINDADTMPIQNSLDKNTLRKMKEMEGGLKPGSSDGDDIADYYAVPYGGKPLGGQTYQAFIDYMWQKYRDKWNKDHGVK